MITQMDSVTLTGVSDTFADPTSAILNEEQQQQIETEIAKLPKREHEVLLLRLAHGLSYKQIADITDLSVSHVGVLLHQAVQRLRVALADPQLQVPTPSR